jgi:hypothetical protein
MGRLDHLLAEAGGPRAPRERISQLRGELLAALERGRSELTQPRSGYREPVVVAVAQEEENLRGVAPVAPELRADTQAASERSWLLVAALLGALFDAAELGPPAAAPDLRLRVGALGGNIVLEVPSVTPDGAELAALAFEDQARSIDRLRAQALAVPPPLLADATDLRPPIGTGHPLQAAEAIARLGGQPADAASTAAHEEAVLALLQPAAVRARPHEDRDPARRTARRILQRLAGMGKWGGYHTEFTHIARGFPPGNERAFALEVGERLLAAGLLEEKRSVGQRHVFLNSRRAGDIYALVDDGAVPPGLELP